MRIGVGAEQDWVEGGGEKDGEGFFALAGMPEQLGQALVGTEDIPVFLLEAQQHRRLAGWTDGDLEPFGNLRRSARNFEDFTQSERAIGGLRPGAQCQLAVRCRAWAEQKYRAVDGAVGGQRE